MKIFRFVFGALALWAGGAAAAQAPLLLGSGEKAERLLKKYESDKEKYTKDSEKAMKQAEETTAEATHTEDKALFYDFGEGLLEIGLVLTSLYFIARSKIFPMVGITAAAIGVVVAVLGYLK